MLVLLIDMAGTDEREPWDDYRQLLTELELYDPALLKRPRLVAANKMDEAPAPEKLKDVPGQSLAKLILWKSPPRSILASRS